jgi:hypothetical protein
MKTSVFVLISLNGATTIRSTFRHSQEDNLNRTTEGISRYFCQHFLVLTHLTDILWAERARSGTDDFSSSFLTARPIFDTSITGYNWEM